MKKIILLLFSVISLNVYSQSTDSLKLDYYEYFNLYSYEKNQRMELVIDSIGNRFGISNFGIEFQDTTGYIQYIEIQHKSYKNVWFILTPVQLEELFQDGTLKDRFKI